MTPIYQKKKEAAEAYVDQTFSRYMDEELNPEWGFEVKTFTDGADWMQSQLQSELTALKKDAICHVQTMKMQIDTNRRLSEQTTRYKTALNGMFDEIKHGDEEHQLWLKNKIDSYLKALPSEGAENG